MLINKKTTKPYKAVYLNHLHQFSALVFIIIIFFFGVCTTFFISTQEKTRLLQKSHDAATEFNLFVQNKSTDFWKTYIPMFEGERLSNSVSSFYENNSNSLEKTPSLRKELVNTLSEITATSNDIIWILLYREADETSYLYYKNSGVFEKTPADFPFLNQIDSDSSAHFLSGSESITVPLIVRSSLSNKRTYAITGNVFSSNSSRRLGSIMVGLDTAALNSIYLKYRFDIPTDIFVTTKNGDIIYTSTGNYDEVIDPQLFTHKSGDSFSFQETSYFLETITSHKQEYYVFNRISENALTKASRKYNYIVWLICFILSIFSASLYIFTGWLSARKTNTILDGVHEISKNNLSYRIPVDRSADEFSTIATQINTMAEQMQDYIQKVYLYSLKQKNAELGELQAKFNPHFLYNTLEVIHSRLLQNGDDECADMVLLLSRIFRNFINQKSFVSIREELSLCKLYIQLFEIRYMDEFETVFDVDSEILEYNIIRNLTQPAIENYFVHGFTSQNPCNQISISGYFSGPDHIVLQIIDNGSGISPEKLKEIQTSLSSEISAEDTSYGLKNINDRIKTFYGEECGLSIDSELGKGTTITMTIRKLTNEQHVNRFKQQNLTDNT